MSNSADRHKEAQYAQETKMAELNAKRISKSLAFFEVYLIFGVGQFIHALVTVLSAVLWSFLLFPTIDIMAFHCLLSLFSVIFASTLSLFIRANRFMLGELLSKASTQYFICASLVTLHGINHFYADPYNPKQDDKLGALIVSGISMFVVSIVKLTTSQRSSSATASMVIASSVLSSVYFLQKGMFFAAFAAFYPVFTAGVSMCDPLDKIYWKWTTAKALLLNVQKNDHRDA